MDLDLNVVASPYGPESDQSRKNRPDELIKSSQRFVRDEASYVFYGMIHGFQVIYRPPDRFHNQDETFLVLSEKPEMIRPDDLEIYHISNVGYRYYYSVRKQLDRFESFAIQAWEQGNKKTLQGGGAVAFAAAAKAGKDTDWQSPEPELMIQLRKSAIDNAIKQAVRAYFRRELRNKPAQIRVNLALSDVPEISVGSGELRARVRLHMGQYNIERYQTKGSYN
ncbi:hypothetical protein P0082_06215 [Candidatus Haliotispira prima]|uniref:Uncharacterized protein n=1 Tax=Candidatus Haliotispira prima TaxID=3034016 RepID=A0ABY8MDM8_9SPIO|nr:hypothetical protein P0082_06215 [Candidatus Haliotispira prima]